MLKKKMKLSNFIRRVIQVVFFFTLPALYTSAFSGILKAGMACLHGTGRSPTIRMFQTVMTIEKRSSDHESIYG